MYPELHLGIQAPEYPSLLIRPTRVLLHLQERGFFLISYPLTTLFLQFPRSGGKRRKVHAMAIASNIGFEEEMPKTEKMSEKRVISD